MDKEMGYSPDKLVIPALLPSMWQPIAYRGASFP